MENPKFKSFINEVYEASKDKMMEEKVFGLSLSKPSLYGRIYIANSSPSFFDIVENTKEKHPVKAFLDSYRITPDMFHLQSRKNDEEEDIYEYQYVSHTITEDKIIVETTKRTVTFEL